MEYHRAVAPPHGAERPVRSPTGNFWVDLGFKQYSLCQTCFISPLTLQDNLRLLGSPISSLDTTAGPIGANASIALPSNH